MSCMRYIVAEPADIKQASRTAMKVIGLNYKISGDGGLKKSVLTAGEQTVMGISDEEITNPVTNAEKLCCDIFYEAKSGGYRGVLFDFESRAAWMYPFVSALSYGLFERGLKHYVPERFHSAAPCAKLIINAAVSGGSFADMYGSAVQKYGKERISFELSPGRHDFIIPSYSAEGKALSQNEFDNITEKYHPSVYFSSELLAKYFTYRDSTGNFHFVIFDDAATVQEKLAFFDNNRADSVFMLFSDWKRLFGEPG